MVLALWLLIPPPGQGFDAPENPAPWTGLAVLPFVLGWTALIAVVPGGERDAGGEGHRRLRPPPPPSLSDPTRDVPGEG